MDRAAALRNVPVFSGLLDEQLEHLAAAAQPRRVGAGAWLMREGEPAESLFVVVSGRLEVVDEGPPETVIRVLRRGDVLGHLALLTQGTRSASVRAHRPSELLELDREHFEALIRDAPSFAVALTYAMGAQLAASRAPATEPPAPTTVAVVALDPGASAAATTDGLAAALRGQGSVAVLVAAGEPSRAEMFARLEQAEAGAKRVVLRADAPPGDGWTDFCLGEADLVVAVTSGRPSRDWAAHTAGLAGCELLVRGPAVEPATITALAPREVQVLPSEDELDAGLASLARRLAGRSVGLVLSGGGARAFAHIGVLDELYAQGIVVDRVGGVSLGAIVGAIAATGADPDSAYETFRQGFIETNPTNDYTLPAFSLVRGGKTRRLLHEAFGERRIEELPRRYFCLSCDLIAREVVIHRTGPLWGAIYASMAIPGVFPPVPTPEGRLLVDGGVLDNLPVATMAATGEGPVIAVDVTGRMGSFKRPPRPGLARLARPMRRLLTGGEAELPRLGETLLRTLTVGSVDTVAAARTHADLVIAPQVDGIGLLDWRQLAYVREAGREAAREALATAPPGLLP
jgi:predicted acylesterase/phospholipase RssA/CRP-like cAMP-binding protein